MTENQEKAKSYLNEIRNYHREHNQIVERIQLLRTECLPDAMTYDSDKVQTSPTDRLSRNLAEAIDLERDLIERDYEMHVKTIRALEIIRVLANPEQRIVLNNHYVLYHSWNRIAKILNKSKSHTYYVVHFQALEEFGKRLT